jgi:hypothetical protein
LGAYANSIDSALDEAADYLAVHAPGLLANEQYQEAYEEAHAKAIAAGHWEDEAIEIAHDEASVGMTCAGNHGEWLLSWEWGIAAENPTREQRLALFGGGAK